MTGVWKRERKRQRRGTGHRNNQQGLVAAGLKPRPSRRVVGNAGQYSTLKRRTALCPSPRHKMEWYVASQKEL